MRSAPNRTLEIRLLSRLGSLLLSLAVASVAAGDPVDKVEGVYHYHNGYQAETLELRAGHFRYWFSTDYGLRSGDQPLEGAYSIEGSTLTCSAMTFTWVVSESLKQLKARTSSGDRKRSRSGMGTARSTPTESW